MGQREIEKRLKQYAAECGKIVPADKENMIQELLRTEASQEGRMTQNFLQAQQADPDNAWRNRTRGTLWNYIWEQTGYLGKYCFIWQAAWIVLFCYMMRHGVSYLFGENNRNAFLVTISLLTPLLMLLTVEEITKVYQRSMLEIEYATKYSLRSAVMIRMSVLCVVHSLILILCIVCMHSRIAENIGTLLIYGFTPMIIETAVLFKLMQYCQGEALLSVAAGVYVLTAGLAIVGNTEYFDWYQPGCFNLWCIACIIGIVFGVRQFIRLNGKLTCYEMVVGYETD